MKEIRSRKRLKFGQGTLRIITNDPLHDCYLRFEASPYHGFSTASEAWRSDLIAFAYGILKACGHRKEYRAIDLSEFGGCQ
jgi:hypothetical protein